MSLVHTPTVVCGQTAAGTVVALQRVREAGDNNRLIFARLVSIAIRKYAVEPGSRRAAVRMILMNAVRLCALHLGEQETASIVQDTLNERGAA